MLFAGQLDCIVVALAVNTIIVRRRTLPFLSSFFNRNKTDEEETAK